MKAGLKAKALRLLARREHSRAELMRRLAGEASREEIAAVLDQLEAAGLLSEARAAEAFVSARAARYGVARLRHDLQARGFSAEVIAGVLAEEEAGELARARALWQRKFGARPADRAAYARQARFLAGRGFRMEVIRRVLGEEEE